MKPAQKALQKLKDGNLRYTSQRGLYIHQYEHDINLAIAQKPFAIVLGCADSRVPVEIIFDQPPGKLFVLRVAGNIFTPYQAGSIEYAVEQLGVRLILVLGHSNCGAVQATLNYLENPAESISANLMSIIKKIEPAIKDIANSPLSSDKKIQLAVRQNIQQTIKNLQEESLILNEKIKTGELMILGAEYDLETGAIEFIDN